MKENRTLQLETSSNAARGFGWMFLATAAGGTMIVLVARQVESLGYLLCMGLPALMGLALLSLRRGLSVDLDRRTLTRWRGVGLLTSGEAFPLKRSEAWPLESAERIEVKLDLPEDEEWPAFYAAVIPGKSDSFTVESSQTYETVRGRAEFLARGLGLSLVDTSQEESSTPRKRPPPAPGPALTTSQDVGRSQVVQVPASKSLDSYIQSIGIFLCSIFLALGALFALKDISRLLSAFAAGVWVCTFLFYLLRAERSRSVSYRLRGGRQGLEIEAQWTWGRTRYWLTPEELRQIDVVRAERARDWENAELLIRGERLQLRLGSHVPREELRERARELRAALELPTGPRPSGALGEGGAPSLTPSKE